MCLTRDGDCSLHRLRPARQLSATRTRDTDKRRHREEGNVSLSLLLSRVCVSCLCLVSRVRVWLYGKGFDWAARRVGFIAQSTLTRANTDQTHNNNENNERERRNEQQEDEQR